MAKMLKRNDLVKQFELVVTQEIKNYQDSLLSTNLAINALKKDIQAVDEKLSKRLSFIESRLKVTEDFERDASRTFQGYEQDLQATAHHLKRFENSLEEFKKTFEFFFEKRDSEANVIKEKVVESMEKGVERDHKIALLEKLITFEKGRLQDEIKKESSRLKEELSEKPSFYDDFKGTLTKKLESHAVEKKSIFKEIKVFRKELFVLQKNIENIYTMLERLKKRGEG